MKKIIMAIVCVFLMLNTSVYAAISSMSEAVNKSGANRMLTQRMLKDYILIAMKNSYKDPSKDLLAAISIFDNTMMELRAYISDKAILDGLNKINTLWSPIKNKLQETGNKNDIVAFEKEVYILLLEINTNTGLIAKSSGDSSSEMVNIAGRQRMYSQRMAMLYMMKVWGVDDPAFAEKLTMVMSKFETVHQRLKKSSLNTDETTKLLAQVDKSFMFFTLMGKSKSKRFIPSLVNRSANNILKDMNKVTSLYILNSK